MTGRRPGKTGDRVGWHAFCQGGEIYIVTPEAAIICFLFALRISLVHGFDVETT
jgi:hypothetical protein